MRWVVDPQKDAAQAAASPLGDDYAADIPCALANAAHAWTSHVPEVRGAQEIADYVATLESDHAALAAGLDPSRVGQLVEEFARYRAGYRRRFLAHLSARGRCASTMITGGSGFDTRRNGKANDRADKHAQGLAEFRARALAAIRKTLHPEEQPIRSGDDDAVERLRAEIAEGEAKQARMREANAVIRKHAKAGADTQVAALVSLGFGEARARDLLKPDFCGRIGFADYELSNNRANVVRLRARLAEVTVAKATPAAEVQGANARLEDDPPGNRVRLFFPGKPAPETIARLKRAGFRWAPSAGAWSAYRSALPAAREIAGVSP